MNNPSDVLDELQAAIELGKKANKALEAAEATLEPLRASAKEANNHVAMLMRRFQGLNGDTPGPARRSRSRHSNEPKRTYNISPATKIAKAGKTAQTRAITKGASEKDALKAKKEAEAAMRAKLGG
jgi:hypothetical protein